MQWLIMCLCFRALHAAYRWTSWELSAHLPQTTPKNPTAFDYGNFGQTIKFYCKLHRFKPKCEIYTANFSFSLSLLIFRLRDGSEYLFNTTSRFMMKKWIMKIQASAGKYDYGEPFIIFLCHNQIRNFKEKFMLHQHKIAHDCKVKTKWCMIIFNILFERCQVHLYSTPLIKHFCVLWYGSTSIVYLETKICVCPLESS